MEVTLIMAKNWNTGELFFYDSYESFCEAHTSNDICNYRVSKIYVHESELS